MEQSINAIYYFENNAILHPDLKYSIRISNILWEEKIKNNNCFLFSWNFEKKLYDI